MAAGGGEADAPSRDPYPIVRAAVVGRDSAALLPRHRLQRDYERDYECGYGWRGNPVGWGSKATPYDPASALLVIVMAGVGAPVAAI